jgi:hypothetical protein
MNIPKKKYQRQYQLNLESKHDHKIIPTTNPYRKLIITTTIGICSVMLVIGVLLLMEELL